MQFNYHIVIVSALALFLSACDKPAPSSSGAAAVGSPPVTAHPAPEAYQATLQDGIQFSKPGYPSFIKEVKGMSGLEPKGRWTDGSSATFVFKEPIKGAFQLKLSGMPYGPNIGKKVLVIFGGLQKEVVFSGKSNNFESVSAEFDLKEPADTLEIRIPEPTTPLGGNRKLGIFLRTLNIITY